MYRTICRALAVAGAAGLLAITGAGAARATTSYLGPVYPGPGTTAPTMTGGDGAIAKAGGETWTYSGFDTSQFGQMVWGPWDANSVELSFDAISDTSFSTPGEVLQFNSADSDLANGKIVFTGHADISVSNGGGYIQSSYDTRFTMLVTDPSDNAPISLVDPTSLGLDGGIGGQVSVNDNLTDGWQANLLFEASADGTHWTPAADLFNALGDTDPTTEVHTNFDAGYYYTPAAPPLTITPDPYDFGSTAVGTQSSSQEFVFQNTSTSSVTLDLHDSQASGDASQFKGVGGDCTDGMTLDAGDSCTVDFAFAPTSSGPKSATFTLVDPTDTPIGSLTLDGTGVNAASLSASPDGLDFGNVYAGTSSAKQTVTITNNGGADATSFGLVLSGPNASSFKLVSTTCGSTLAANSSCTATLRLKATGVGDRSATLTASSPGTSAAVDLDGTSVASADLHTDIAETPESPVPNGGQVTWTITVWDSGPSGAKGVTLADALPAGTRFVSLTKSTGKCTSPHAGAVGTVVCTLGRLPRSGAPATVTITATITAATGSTITDTATVSGALHDPHPENNSASIDTDVS